MSSSTGKRHRSRAIELFDCLRRRSVGRSVVNTCRCRCGARECDQNFGFPTRILRPSDRAHMAVVHICANAHVPVLRL